MIRKHRYSFAAAAVLAAVSLVPAATAETLKFGAFGSGKSPFYTMGLIPFTKRVEAKSNGGLKVQLYVNTLGRAPELYENTKNGLGDVSWVIASAQRGYKFPRSEVLSLPFVQDGYSNAQASIALWNLYAKGLVAKDFDEVIPIAFASMSPTHVVTKGKMAALDCLTGMKLAVTSGPTARTAKALGAIPVFTSVTDLYQSMSRGTVDGILVGFTAIKFFRLDEVTDRHLVMPLDAPLVFIAANRKKLDSLPRDKRELLLGEAGAKLSGALGSAADRMVGWTKQGLSKNPKQQIRYVPKDEQPAWRKRVRPLIDRWVGATPNGAAILAAYKAELEALKRMK